MSSSKDSLLASLTGDLPVVESSTQPTDNLFPSEEESDLFGSVTEEPLLFASNEAPSTNTAAAASNSTTTTPSTTQETSNLLAQSGLLGDQEGDEAGKEALNNKTNGVASSSSNGGGGGLFDSVDEEEARLAQQQAEEAEQRRLEQQEQQRLQQQEQQQRLMQQQQQEQQQRLMQQQQQRMMQQQQQQQPPYGAQPVYAQQQQQPYAQQQLQQQPYATPPQSQPMPPQPQQPQAPPFSPSGFYRPHETAPSANAAALTTLPPVSSNTYQGSLLHTGRTAPSPYNTTLAQTPQPTQQTLRPSRTAGMHNATTMGRPPVLQVKAPKEFQPVYSSVQVSDPLLVQSGGGSSFFTLSNQPHWSYSVECTLSGGGSYLVRRRFRHVVALEERLHQEWPGAILPPRPDKHATRALEEASSTPTAEFAKARAHELQVYLEKLIQHPLVGSSSQTLKLFLSLQDDLGTAWPEVSSSALTRLGAATTSLVAETSSLVLGSTDKVDSSLAGEDNAQLLALASSEGIRMGAVLQAVPKVEGCTALLREYGDAAGAVGMEVSKLCKELEAHDKDLTVPLSILGAGLLRNGRRQKRLSLELSAALSTFSYQYRLCKMEQRAFGDRRSALQKCQKERKTADHRAQRLLLHQHQQSRSGMGGGELERAEREAVVGDTLAEDAVKECEEIGERLKEEVNRVAFERRTEWSKSMKIIASAMKEASSERVAIWQSTRESFLQAFPEDSSSGSSQMAEAVSTVAAS